MRAAMVPVHMFDALYVWSMVFNNRIIRSVEMVIQTFQNDFGCENVESVGENEMRDALSNADEWTS